MEIEFRGKDIKTGEWRYGVPIFTAYEEKCFICTNDSRGIGIFTAQSLLRFLHKIDPKTVGQYTNVNTHQEEKIFEGDIAKTSYIRAYGIAEYTTIPIIGVVEFLEGTWVINNRVNDMIPLWSETNEIEILGNIHDNPELLEV